MAKHTCPNCQHVFETRAERKENTRTNPGRTGKILCYINAYGRAVNYSVGMAKVIRGRKQGQIAAGNDWLLQYSGFANQAYWASYNAFMAELPGKIYRDAEYDNHQFERTSHEQTL